MINPNTNHSLVHDQKLGAYPICKHGNLVTIFCLVKLMLNVSSWSGVTSVMRGWDWLSFCSRWPRCWHVPHPAMIIPSTTSPPSPCFPPIFPDMIPENLTMLSCARITVMTQLDHRDQYLLSLLHIPMFCSLAPWNNSRIFTNGILYYKLIVNLLSFKLIF